MKKMIYGPDCKKEILYEGTYEGYPFLIVSYGVHPCAYVEIHKDHPLYKKDYWDANINVHGGITYGDYLPNFNQDKSKWFIGWDYAHLGDYEGYYEKFDINPSLLGDKKWTTEEIFEDVKSVIRQLHTFPY